MRSVTAVRASAVTLIAAALTLAAPIAAHAVTTHSPGARAAGAASAPGSTCTITDATATWGVKESFRSYISGSIAKGAWEPFGGVGYETPSFTFTGGTGTFDPATGSGAVAFPGGIRFTGHGGLLDTTVQNVAIEMSPDGGRMLLDLASVSMESALAGDSTAVETPQVPFVTVDLAGLSVDAADGSLTLATTDAATAITAEGYAAFGNYETGTAFDPITLSATGTCPEVTPTPAPEQAEPAATDAATPAAADADDAATSGALPVAVWASIGGALVAVIVGTTAAVIATRRKRAGAGDADAGASSSGATEPHDGPSA